MNLGPVATRAVRVVETHDPNPDCDTCGGSGWTSTGSGCPCCEDQFSEPTVADLLAAFGRLYPDLLGGERPSAEQDGCVWCSATLAGHREGRCIGTESSYYTPLNRVLSRRPDRGQDPVRELVADAAALREALVRVGFRFRLDNEGADDVGEEE